MKVLEVSPSQRESYRESSRALLSKVTVSKDVLPVRTGSALTQNSERQMTGFSAVGIEIATESSS